MEIDDQWALAKTQMPEPPATLAGDALAEWNRIGDYLIALDRVSLLDRQSLSAYCLHWGMFARIMREELSDPTMKLYEFGSSCEVAHPLLGPLNRNAEIIIKVAGQFGMTARTRHLEGDHGNRKSIAEKKLEGNRRKVAEAYLERSVIPLMPEWDKADMAPPSWMNDRAKEEFISIGQELQHLDLYTPIDWVPLSVMCCLFDLYLRAGEQLVDLTTVVMDRQGNEIGIKPHPLHKASGALFDTLQFIWKDYASTPRFRKIFDGERKVRQKKEIPLVFKGKFA